MKRRAFIQGTGAMLGLAVAGCSTGSRSLSGSVDTSSDTGADTGTNSTGPSSEEFSTELVIPPELAGTWEDDRRVIELSIEEGTTEFFSGQPADTWGYNGALLGPTLRVRRGDALTIRVTNNLSEDCTTHWHGAHLPASADGGPHQVIAPGETWSSQWTVDQVGCTNWYHPHTMGETARQVYMGLAGLFILDDDEIDALDLPSRYGVDDIPIIVQDRNFTSDGQLDYSMSMMEEMEGFHGDTHIVNGVIKPFINVEAKQIRLRILNGSNASFYEFAFSDGAAFMIIGVDNSLLEAPAQLTSLRMGPGERAEIVVDLTDRQGESLRFVESESGAELMEINVTDPASVVTEVPAALVTLEHIDPEQAVRTRTFELSMGMGGGMGGGGGFTINGASMDIAVINEEVPVDDVEIWEISNVASMMDEITHDFHMHGRHFEVLTRNGEPVGPHEQGYKDTVIVDSGDTVRLAVQHRDYTDDTSPYMYHCHVLEHEDAGMMGQFVVV